MEGSPNLYTITLPPGMLTCVNAAGAMRLLNRTRVTLWHYIKAGRLRSFSLAGNIVIPLVDIAAMLDTTENKIYNVSVTYKIPLWQIHPEGM